MQPGLDHQQDGKGEQQDGGDETGRMVDENVEAQPADRDGEQDEETEEIEEGVFTACHVSRAPEHSNNDHVSSIPGMCRIHIAHSMEANLIATITIRPLRSTQRGDVLRHLL